MAVVDPRYVYEDLLAMPADGKRHELADGDLLVSPSPNPRHQRIVGNVFAQLRRLESTGLGQAYVAPLDVVFDRHTVFEPDVFFVRTERLGIVTATNVAGAPDLVVEVLSESTRDVDLGLKLRAYSRHGVGEYWVVEPEGGTVTVYRRDGRGLQETGTFGAGQTLTLCGVVLEVDAVLA